MAKKKSRYPKACRLGNVNPDGSEKLCSKPTALRQKIIEPVTLRSKMKSLWKEFQEKDEHESSEESLEDAQDFDIDKEYKPKSPYEVEGEFHDQLDHIEANSIHIEEQPTQEQVQPAEKENNDGKISD